MQWPGVRTLKGNGKPIGKKKETQQQNRFIASIGFPSTTQAATTIKKMDQARVSLRQPAKKRKTRKGLLSADYKPGGFDT